jgi:hypothetical protein
MSQQGFSARPSHTPSFRSFAIFTILTPPLSLLEGLTFFIALRTFFPLLLLLLLLCLPSPRVGLRGGSASSRRPGTPRYGPIHVLHLHLHFRLK